METQTLLLDDGVGLLIGGVPRTVLASELDGFFWGMAPFSRVCAFRVHARGPRARASYLNRNRSECSNRMIS